MGKVKKWRFVSNLNAIDDGLNDAGIETFSGDASKANIREVIQNSIDQISEEAKYNKLPVVVEFDDFMVDNRQFPGLEQFKKILDKCILSSSEDKVVKDFFQQARSLVERPIKVLRISDKNTTGLVGAETGAKGEPWYSLIKSKGSSNKYMNSGGSFGIGKSAPFACSGLRTVFYASKVDEIESYIGVSRLISFEDDEGLTIGTGYFAEDERLQAILEPFGMNGFQRTENGTDIYIMGYDGEEHLKEMIFEATLTNFFVSINKGLLVVRYKDAEINKGNLGQYIAMLSDKDHIDTKMYYKLLCAEPSPDDPDVKKIILDSDEFGKEYGIQDGECTLLLMRGDDLNRRILMTRQPGMSLFQQSRIHSSISFTGILLITGDNMNELFKAMEVPAHDAWMPKRCKVDTQRYVRAYERLRKYLREKVNEYFGHTKDDVITAYGMEEFFSDIEEEDGKVKKSVLEGKAKTEVERRRVVRKKHNRIIAGRGDEETAETSSKKRPDPEHDHSPGRTKSSSKGSKFKYVELKKRLRCNDEKNGKYTLSFKIDRAKKVIKLEFIGIAEKGVYSLDLLAVDVRTTDIGKFTQNGNVIIIEKIDKNTEIIIDFQIEFDHKCMMEVNCYENK